MQTAKTASGAQKAQFTYGSDGRKLSEKARTGGFEYMGSLIYAYRGGTLSLAQAVTDEGTIQSAGVNYFIRDHLGSVRAVVDHTGKTVERNDYYPFGGRHENASLPLTGVNRYKFGGKESLEPVSLDSSISEPGSTTRGSLAGIRRTRWRRKTIPKVHMHFVITILSM